MTAPTTTPIRLTKARLRQYRADLRELDGKYDRLSHIPTFALGYVYDAVTALGLPGAFGRSKASLRAERDYRARAFYTRSLSFFDRTTTSAAATDYFGTDGFEDQDPVRHQRARFSLLSADGTRALVYDLSPVGMSMRELEYGRLNEPTRSFILRAKYSVPAFVKVIEPGKPLLIGTDMLGAQDDLRVRHLYPVMPVLVNALARNRFDGVWRTLERTWCELLNTERPLTRRLKRVGIEARLRAYTGASIRIVHGDEVTVGRCPTVADFVDSDFLTVETATGSRVILLHSIREVGPWQAGWGSSFITKPQL